MEIKHEKSAHFYDCRNGEPVPAHDADLRDARKGLFYTSPTTVLKDEFVNPQLDRWKINQVLETAADNYKQPHESVEEYAQRIYDLSLGREGKGAVAANFGKEIHDAIEMYPQLPLNPNLHPWIDKFGAWFNSQNFTTVCSEKIVVDHDIGVAGRLDRVVLKDGSLVLPDFKTQGIKTPKKGTKKPAFYDSWVRQLAFYAVAYSKSTGAFPTIPRCLSVVIDSTEASSPYVYEWTHEEILSGYEDFVIATYRWHKSRNYWPTPGGRWSPLLTIPMPI